MDIVIGLKDSTAGHDEIRSSLIIKTSSTIIKPLTYIFAKSLERVI